MSPPENGRGDYMLAPFSYPVQLEAIALDQMKHTTIPISAVVYILQVS